MQLLKPIVIQENNTRANRTFRRLLIGLNMDYVLALFMSLLAAAIELAPRDPLVLYIQAYNGYGPVFIKYGLIVFAAWLWRAAPSNYPLNVFLAWPLLLLYGLSAQYLASGSVSLETAGTPWVSMAMTWIALVSMLLLGLRNFVVATLYEQLVECEAERQRGPGGSHAAPTE